MYVYFCAFVCVRACMHACVACVFAVLTESMPC